MTARRITLAVVALGVAVGLALGLQHARFLFSRQVEAYHDWDHVLLFAHAAVRSVRAGELPFWDPFPCGGTPLFATPDARIYTPFFLLHLIFGAVAGLRIEIVAHLIIAAVGMAWLVLAHAEETSTPAARIAGATAAALVFAGSTLFPLHLAEGHTMILAVAYFPWVWLLFEQGLADARRAALAGALIALIIGEGGTYPAPQVALFLVLYAGLLALDRRSWRPFYTLGITGLFAGLLAAPRLLPMWALMRRLPRLVKSHELLPTQALVHALLDRDQGLTRAIPWRYYGWHEIGAYVGGLALGLAILAVLWGRRRNQQLAELVLMALVIAVGAAGRFAPWTLLHRLPVFSSQRVPSRFLILAVLFIAALAGDGLRLLLDRMARPARAWAALGLVLWVAVDVMTARAGILGPVRCVASSWPAQAGHGEPFITHEEAPLAAYCRPTAAAAPTPEQPLIAFSALDPAASAGVAIIDAYEPMCPRAHGQMGREPGLSAADRPRYRGEAWLAAGRGEVRIVGRTQSSITLQTTTAEPARVVINQNWDSGWRADGCRLVADSEARLAVEVPAGRHRCALHYRAPLFGVGIALALLGAALIWLL